MDTRKIKTGYILIAFLMVFCIYAFTALDAFDFLGKQLPHEEISTKVADKTNTLYKLTLTLIIMVVAVANVFYWRHGKPLFFWLSALFIVLTVAGLSHLQESLFTFNNQGKLKGHASTIFYTLGAIQIVLFNGVLLINYFVVKALKTKRRKKHPRETLAVVS